MKWFFLGLATLGIALLIIGYRECNNMAQSADVRIGGLIFVYLGIACLVLVLIAACIAFFRIL